MRHATAEHRDEGHDGAEEGVRTCALTRVRRPKDELIRFVLGPDGIVAPDLARRPSKPIQDRRDGARLLPRLLGGHVRQMT